MPDKRLLPLFKWSGGKRKEVSYVYKYMPIRYETYCEPFLGGGAVWLELKSPRNIVGDANKDVINFYNVVKQHGQSFIDDLNSMSTFYTDTMARLKIVMDANKKKPPEMCPKEWRKQKREEYKPLAEFYYEWRDGAHTSDYDLAKRFYILRNLAFGGMLRYNSEGKFNVPYGYYKTFKTLKWNDDYQTLFDNTAFESLSWEETVNDMGPRDFVFLDPPYTREFTQYASGKDFGKADHEALAEWFKSNKTKAMIILNKDAFTTQLYKDYIKEEYEFSYNVRYRKDRLTKDDVTTYHFIATNY